MPSFFGWMRSEFAEPDTARLAEDDQVFGDFLHVRGAWLGVGGKQTQAVVGVRDTGTLAELERMVHRHRWRESWQFNVKWSVSGHNGKSSGMLSLPWVDRWDGGKLKSWWLSATGGFPGTAAEDG
jgi:hypothetical protein